MASLTPTGSDTARSFTADGEHTLLLYMAASRYHHPQEELQLLILVTVAPHKFIAQPECVIKLEICSANLAGPCLEQQA